MLGVHQHKKFSLLQEHYAPVFEALNHAAVSSCGETHGDQLAQMLVDMQEGNEESGSGENESEQKPEKTVRMKVEGLI